MAPPWGRRGNSQGQVCPGSQELAPASMSAAPGAAPGREKKDAAPWNAAPWPAAPVHLLLLPRHGDYLPRGGKFLPA